MPDAPRRARLASTVMRPSTPRRYAAEAGFRAIAALPIEDDFWRFYRLAP